MSFAYKMLKLLAVLASCFCVGHAALAVRTLQEKPEKFKDQEGCYIEQLDAVIPFGESAPSTASCMEYRCEEALVTFVKCGITMVQPPCHTVTDKKKPYPDCCPRAECPSYINTAKQ